MVQKLGSPGGMGTRCRIIAAEKFGGSKINQDQYVLPTGDRVRPLKRYGEPFACAGVVPTPGKDVTGCGAQLRGTGVVERRGGKATSGLVEDGVCAVKGLARCGMLTPIRMNGGLDSGKPASDGWGGPGVLAGCGEVIQRSRGEAFGGGKLGGVPMRDRGELIVCYLPGGIERQGVVSAARHGIAEVVSGKLAGKDRDLCKVAQQPTPLIRWEFLPQSVLRHSYVRSDRRKQGRRISGLIQGLVAHGELFKIGHSGCRGTGVTNGIGGTQVK
jgi:hypothetical protein